MAADRGTELQDVSGIVDDEAENEDDQDKPKSKPMDWDSLCAYKTFKVVRIKDRNLGILYWGIVSCVVVYIIIFALGVEGKHQYQEPGIGTVITRFHGKAFVNGDVYDEADLRFPEVEPFGAFIMTKSITVKKQKIETCVDYDNVCPCRAGAVCKDGFCEDTAWCPSIGDGNAKSPPQGAVVRKVEGLHNTVMEIMCGIAFPGIGNYFFVAGKSPESVTLKYRNITLGHLLAEATPPVKMEDVLDTGALIGVSFYWNCDVTVDCEPSIVIKRLDHGKGFVQKRVQDTSEAAGTRDAQYMYGLRILVDSSGIGRQFSFVLIVIQIGSGLALLRTASMASDFLMLKLYSTERKGAYEKCKIITSQDYSDLQDRINLISEQKQEEKNPQMNWRRTADRAGSGRAGAGAGVSLGLGPGGRGGMASTILRGRS